MNSTIILDNEALNVNLDNPIDISIPLRSSKDNVSAWGTNPPSFEPVVAGNFIGDVNQGGSVNFKEAHISPHGNGTHTECVGHISKENYTINQCLKKFLFKALLITVAPKEVNGDKIIDAIDLQNAFTDCNCTALIIRTLPNENDKLNRQYTGTNPPYLTVAAMDFINNKGIKHLLLDLPSVDREDDGGKVAAHHLFWNYPDNPQTDKTITEMIYVPNEIKDGIYLLNIQIAAFEMDASPSKPVLYKIIA